MADLMNPGGGLTNSKLLLADTNPEDVAFPKKFYSNGNKEIQTGTLQERGQYQMAGGVGGGGSGSTAYVAFNDIPEGIYRKEGSDWAPEIRALKSDVLSYMNAWIMVDLGTGSSFNVSSYPGYRNFTASNFLCEPQNLDSTGGKVWVGAGDIQGKAGFNMTKSYNSSNGVFTVKANAVGGWGNGYSVGLTVRVYLRYRG